MSKPEVVITGLGIVSPYGCNIHEYYDRLAACEIALKPTPWMPPEAGSWFSGVPDFNPEDWMSAQVADGSDRFAQFALAGVKQALEHAGIEELHPLRTAIVMGTSMGGTRAVERGQHLLETQGPAAVPRKLQILIWPNMAAAQIAMAYHLHGPFMTVTTACAGGVDSIGTACRFIQNGQADVAITGATEGTGGLEFMSALGANAVAYGMTKPADDPSKVCRPFDRDRTGIAGCEGAGMFVLESREHAEARGAKIHGVIRGYANLADAYHPSSPNPTGEWEALVMRQALEEAASAERDEGDRGVRPRHGDAEGRHGRDQGDQRRLRRPRPRPAGDVAEGSHGPSRQFRRGDEHRRRDDRHGPRRGAPDGEHHQRRP